MSLLIDQPLLIHRPLLEVDGVCRAGFNPAAIHAWIGLSAAFGGATLEETVEVCFARRGAYRGGSPALDALNDRRRGN